MTIQLCSNRPEGFGPISHRYSHILTSCFLDTILVPLCTWIYFLALGLLFVVSSRAKSVINRDVSQRRNFFRSSKQRSSGQTYSPSKTRRLSQLLFGLLLFAVIAMCVIEIVRLALAHLGIGLLPFTIVGLVLAALVHFTEGFGGKIIGSNWLNLGYFLSLAVVNAVKLAEEMKEGSKTRKGTKYPMSDQITDVSVMIGLYVVLGVFEILL